MRGDQTEWGAVVGEQFFTKAQLMRTFNLPAEVVPKKGVPLVLDTNKYHPMMIEWWKHTGTYGDRLYRVQFIRDARMVHRLKIISYHDANAECICGEWDYCATGLRTHNQIEAEFQAHLAGRRGSVWQ